MKRNGRNKNLSFKPIRGTLHWRRGFQGFRREFQSLVEDFAEDFVEDFDKDLFISAMPGGGGSGETNTTSGAVGGSGNASVTLQVGGLEPFNTKGEAQNLSQRWKKWKRAFNLYVTGKGVSNDAQKRALLLHVAGMDVQEIYFTLAGEGEGTDFEATLKVLDDYFVPKANIPFERHLFRQISQENGETVDQFVCRLRQRAATCEFGANEGDYIRDQLIDRCYSSHLRRKFLEKEGTVTLDDLLRIARSQEAVDRFLEVAILKSTTSAKVIEALAPMFARFGLPFSLRTDNGPQFVSVEFETFLRYEWYRAPENQV